MHRAWETAIDAYIGEDPLELWFNFICWYEHNVALDTENSFEAILGKCLSMYEYKENFKQDTRMVQLWMKYVRSKEVGNAVQLVLNSFETPFQIDLKPNALNLYQLLYQRNVGTKCTIFYVGWARYFESAGAMKQAESVFNLGFQVKAEPFEDLKEAHTKFRMAVAQRAMYEGSADIVHSKKRSASSEFDEDHIEQQSMPQHNGTIHQPTHIPDGVASDNAAHENHSPMQPSAKRPRPESPTTYNNNEETCPDNGTAPCDLNNSANVISSSLYSVYDDAQPTGYADEAPIDQEYDALRINLPPSFVSFSSSNDDNWSVALCLEEPYEPNKFCNYPKAQVYPGDDTEYSPEEIRGRKWARHLEAIQEQRLQAEFQQQEADRLEREEAERLRLESEHERLVLEEQERLRAAAEYERHRVAEQERIRIAEYQRRAADLNRKRLEQEQEQHRIEQIQLQQQQQFQQQQQQYYQLNRYSHHSASATNTTTSVIRTVNDDAIDDDDEQIEASTIRFTGNGLSKPKTITIKFRKEKPAIAAPQQVPSTPPPHHQTHYHQLQSTDVAIPVPSTADTPQPKAKKEKKSRLSKKLLNGLKHSHQPNHHQEPDEPPVGDTNLMLDIKNHQELPPPPQPSSDDSNFSYAGSSYATPATPNSTHRTTRYARLTGDDEDSCSNSDFPYSGDNSNGYTPRTSKPFHAFESGHSSTPMRSTPVATANGNYLNDAFAKSTPRNFKILKKRGSNVSYQNDDSMCSLSSTLNGAEQNSFFASENDTELQQRRLDKALATIQTHLDKPTLDPFNSELCKAFLTKIGFPSREHSDTYKLVSQPINKLGNARMAMLANVPFQIEKEVGRGSYGSVYRATNATTGATVALKYQKPANNWELYICTEVHRRIKNPDVVSLRLHYA